MGLQPAGRGRGGLAGGTGRTLRRGEFNRSAGARPQQPSCCAREQQHITGVSESSPGHGPRRETFQSPNPAPEEHELNTTRRNVALRNVLLHR